MRPLWMPGSPIWRLAWLHRLKGGEQSWATASGNPITFNAVAASLRQLRVDFAPMQAGSGDPSPTNVRPISGHDSVSVTHCGKNLINLPECVYGYWTSDNGTVTQDNRGVRSQYIKVRPMSDITMSTNGTIPFSFSIIELDANGTFVKRTHKSLTPESYTLLSIRTQEATAAVYCQAYNNIDEGATPEWLESIKWQLEIGSATAYEAYNGSTHSISWQNEAGTVYGGYIDLVSGELVEECAIFTFDGTLEYRHDDVFQYVYINLPLMRGGEYSSDPDVMCDRAVKVLSSSSANRLEIKVGNNNNAAFLYNLHRLGITTEEEMRAFLDENPVSFTYPLATPVRYQLTPQTIRTLLGSNNISTDGDLATVTFREA